MLTLAQLRHTRLAKDITRPVITNLTGITTQRLQALELGKAEPWFDEAVLLSQVLCVTGILPLIASGPLTQNALGEPTGRDVDLWRAGVRVPLSLACRVARTFGLADPGDLVTTALARQIWDIVGSNERHPEHAGVCPWCAADVMMGEDHRPTCLPHNLWSVSSVPVLAEEASYVARPAVAKKRVTGIPARGLKAPRLAREMTQAQVAAVLGINVNYYARLERADAPFAVAHADKLAAHYDVDRAVLYAPPADAP